MHCSPTTLNIHEFDREEGDNDVQIDDANTETLELAVAKRNELFTSLLSLESVTVLEIRDANLTKYSEQGNILSLHHLKNLEVLKIVKSSLKTLPHSIGCLSKLRELDVSLNDNLRCLPDTIMHCKKLEKLDIHGSLHGNNQVYFFPGWIRELPALKEVNRKHTRSDHVSWVGNTVSKHHHNPNPVPNAKTFRKLQDQALGAIISSAQNMSVLSLLPTNSHYKMESFLTTNNVRICGHCRKIIVASQDAHCTIQVLFLRFLDLTKVAMKFHACSGVCADTLFEQIEKSEREEQERQDREYDEMVRKANEEFGMEAYYSERMKHFSKIYAQRERERNTGCVGCSIM